MSRDCIFFEKRDQYNSLSFKNLFTKQKKIPFGENSILFFESEKFFIHQQKNILYILKGILGKIGPIFVHFSLTFILLGAILGAIGKYNAQEFIPKGEIIHFQNILGASWLSYFPTFSIRLNDFWIEYKDLKIDQFYSDLSILTNYGEEISQKTICVNNPLNYNQISVYQIDWELLGIRIKNESNIIFQYPLSLIRKTPRIWSTWIFSEDFSDARIIFIDELKQFGKVYDKGGKFLESLNFGENFFMKKKNYVLLDLIPETGLQFKYDPSIPLTFVGFATLIVSTFFSYKTYSQIWILIKMNTILVGGQTTRSQSFFEIEFKKFLKYIQQKNLSKEKEEIHSPR
jgi:cytochrome c biogenesis protein